MQDVYLPVAFERLDIGNSVVWTEFVLNHWSKDTLKTNQRKHHDMVLHAEDDGIERRLQGGNRYAVLPD